MVKFTRVIHQFSLFDFNDMRPKIKVPLKKRSIEEAKAALENRDMKKLALILSDIRSRLEHFESRL